MRALRIGSRGSPLALWQAEYVSDWLERTCRVSAQIIRIRTTGDHVLEPRFTAMGVKGVFIKELEDALLDRRVDIAVHSMKDVPTAVQPGLAFPAIPRRQDVRDCLVSREGRTLAQLAPGAHVGTSSLRRQAQLRRARPDIVPADVRGNVETRIRKLDQGEFDAIVLARAGLERLGLAERISETFDPAVMLPAAGQGALAVEAREDDAEVMQLLAGLDDAETRRHVEAERALLTELEGGCQVPLGAWCRSDSEREGNQLLLDACVCSADGKEMLRDSLRGPAAAPQILGRELAHRLLDAGADRILRLAGRTLGNR
jgi:hydroxymethylbilane synthase